MVFRQRITTIADRWILVWLSLLVIGLPFSNAVTEISIAGIILGWIIIRLANGADNQPDSGAVKFLNKFKVKTGLGVFLSVFVCICLLSLINSNYFYPQSLRGIIRVIKYTFFCLAVADSVNTRARFNNLIILALIIAGLISLNGFVQYFGGTDLIRRYVLRPDKRVASSFGNPNNFGGYLCLLTPVAVCLLFFSPVKKWAGKSWQIALLILLLIVLRLTYSKGAWIGVLISLPLALWFGIKGRNKKRLFIKGLISLIIIVLVILILSQYGLQFWSLTRRSVIVRLDMWQTAINMIEAKPILGQGINTFHAEYGVYRADSCSGPGYAHNCYLQMASEIGLAGLTVFIWIAVNLFGLGLKGIRVIQDNFHRAALLGLLAGLLAFLIHSIVDTNLYSLPLATLFWLAVGLTLSLLKINRTIETTE